MDLAPIAHEYRLRCSPEQAFKVYVEQIAAWWHPDYTASPAAFAGVVIEPFVGGRVYARFHGGADDDWGRVTAWAPGRALSYTSTLAQPPDHPSQITVRFAADGGGTRVAFEHGGWNAGNAAERRKFTEWPRLLDRFRDLADGVSA